MQLRALASGSPPCAGPAASRLHIARGGPARRIPAGGYPPALTLDEMILATILRARFRLPQRVPAELSGVTTATIANAERQIRSLLAQHRHITQPVGGSFSSLRLRRH